VTPLLDQSLIILVISAAAGCIGALLGVGGGIIVVPALTLLLHVPLRVAAAASIVSVIATSAGGASSYVRSGLANVRIGLFLLVATTIGALAGAWAAGILPPAVLFVVFGAMLAYAAVALLRNRHVELPDLRASHPLAERLGLAGTYHDAVLGRDVAYHVDRPWAAVSMIWLAGLLSGLLGIGGGLFNVLAMDSFMKVPMKVATATSTFMVGVTAAASAGVYFTRGDVQPTLAAPVAIGVLLGATGGARLLARFRNRTLRYVFVPVLLLTAGEMILRGA
jgi:uncharacterized membrane protein YfcA